MEKMDDKQREATISLLSGEWEITCGTSNIVWGEAIITTLVGSFLKKHKRSSASDPQGVAEPQHIPCYFRASRADPLDIQVQWGREGGKMVKATLDEHGPDCLRWKIDSKIDGRGRGYAVWRRKQTIDEVDGLEDSLSCLSSSFAVSEDVPTEASASARPVVLSVCEENGGQLPPGWRKIALSSDLDKFMYVHEGGEMRWQSPSISKPRSLAQSPGPMKVTANSSLSSERLQDHNAPLTPPTTPPGGPMQVNLPDSFSLEISQDSVSLTPPTTPPNTPKRQKLTTPSSVGRPTPNRHLLATPPQGRSLTPPQSRVMDSMSPPITPPQTRSTDLPFTPRNKKLDAVLEQTPVKWSLGEQAPWCSTQRLSNPPQSSPTKRKHTPGAQKPGVPGTKRLFKAGIAPEWTPERSAVFSAPESTPERSSISSEGTASEVRKAYVAVEVATKYQQDQVWELHSQKSAFANEHHHLKSRIYDSENGMVQCRSWLLAKIRAEPAQPLEFDACASTASYSAAVTVRLNPYMHKNGRAWAQVMNVSVARERRGHGSRLVAGVEEVLRREGVDVIVLYPVDNNRATNFWASMGYVERLVSHLPVEELDPENGALLPEGFMKDGVKIMLPRWEKSLATDAAPRTSDLEDEQVWKARKREHWPVWRKVDAKLCRLGPEELSEKFKEAQNTRDRVRAWLLEGAKALFDSPLRSLSSKGGS